MAPKKVDKQVAKAEALQPSDYLEPEPVKLKAEHVIPHLFPGSQKKFSVTFG